MTLAEFYLYQEMEKQAGLREVPGWIHGKARNLGGAAAKAVAPTRKAVQEGAFSAAIRRSGAAAMARNKAATGYGIAGGGAALLGGGALLARKLLKKKSLGQKLIAAMKRNKGAIAAGAAGAAGLGALAAYQKRKG